MVSSISLVHVAVTRTMMDDAHGLLCLCWMWGLQMVSVRTGLWSHSMQCGQAVDVMCPLGLLSPEQC
jgi:hypothetical protein